MYTEPPFLLNHGTPDLKFLIFLRLKPNMQVKILCGRFERVQLPCYTLAIRDCKPAPTHVSALLHTLPGPCQVPPFQRRIWSSPPTCSQWARRKHPPTTPHLCSVGLDLASAFLVDDDGIRRVWWVLAHQMGPDSNYDCKSFTVVCKQLVFWSMALSRIRSKKLPPNQ